MSEKTSEIYLIFNLISIFCLGALVRVQLPRNPKRTLVVANCTATADTRKRPHKVPSFVLFFATCFWKKKYLFQFSRLQGGRVIAIRREDQSVWERRAPLSPSNVMRLTRQHVKVIVQPSNRRAYPMQVIFFLFCFQIKFHFICLVYYLEPLYYRFFFIKYYICL